MNTTMFHSSSSQLFNPVLPTDLHIPILTAWVSENRRRGTESEALVEEALCRIKERDYGLGSPIVGFTHAAPNSELDRSKVDFAVQVSKDVEVLLQIKSSNNQRRKFEREMERFGKIIIAITVKAYEEIEQVVHKVVKGIRLALNKMRRKVNDAIAAGRERYDAPRRKDRFFRFHAPRMCH